MVAIGQYVVEEGIGRYAVPSVGGASSSRKETKLEPVASGEHSEAVAIGMMASRFRGIV